VRGPHPDATRPNLAGDAGAAVHARASGSQAHIPYANHDITTRQHLPAVISNIRLEEERHRCSVCPLLATLQRDWKESSKTKHCQTMLAHWMLNNLPQQKATPDLKNLRATLGDDNTVDKVVRFVAGHMLSLYMQNKPVHKDRLIVCNVEKHTVLLGFLPEFIFIHWNVLRKEERSRASLTRFLQGPTLDSIGARWMVSGFKQGVAIYSNNSL